MASRVAQGPPPPAAAKTGVEVPSSEKKAQVAPVSRREFLFYVWGASMAMYLGQTGGLLVWFMLPRFRAGEFGGAFEGVGADIPEKGSAPANYAAGKFWLTNSDKGVVAIYKVCTHLGCLYAWVGQNTRFECPCHGSKYKLDGTWIEGPAPRSLDRFEMTITTTSGQLVSNEIGDPIPVDPSQVQSWIVDTGKKLKRPGRV
jgi:cytochrome b6-f complex iron-sulfur subunit